MEIRSKEATDGGLRVGREAEARSSALFLFSPPLFSFFNLESMLAFSFQSQSVSRYYFCTVSNIQKAGGMVSNDRMRFCFKTFFRLPASCVSMIQMIAVL